MLWADVSFWQCGKADDRSTFWDPSAANPLISTDTIFLLSPDNYSSSELLIRQQHRHVSGLVSKIHSPETIVSKKVKTETQQDSSNKIKANYWLKGKSWNIFLRYYDISSGLKNKIIFYLVHSWQAKHLNLHTSISIQPYLMICTEADRWITCFRSLWQDIL